MAGIPKAFGFSKDVLFQNEAGGFCDENRQPQTRRGRSHGHATTAPTEKSAEKPEKQNPRLVGTEKSPPKKHEPQEVPVHLDVFFFDVWMFGCRGLRS